MKLIRDFYASVIEEEKLSLCPNEHLPQMLMKKLTEEIKELAATEWKDIEEYADVMEVLYALARVHANVTPEQLDKVRLMKLEQKGGFENGLLLKEEI